MLKKKFLDEEYCYFCGDTIHNYELSTLFDGRDVKSCFECYVTVEFGRAMYYCKIADIDIFWENEDVKE